MYVEKGKASNESVEGSLESLVWLLVGCLACTAHKMSHLGRVPNMGSSTMKMETMTQLSQVKKVLVK